ncbi:Fis family transcriptional regulator [Blautia schinkii]|nr:Fis family transcriptional regulator [Blautia schinkii]
MKGKYRIIVQNNKIKYDFEIKRNITVIRGDSATGKTALVDMIQDFYENGVDSGIELQCSRTCAVLSGRNWKMQLSVLHNSIIFIDEGNPFVTSTDFAEEIQKTDNYYVIVTRESLDALPYSVNEIYGIRDSGKYGYLTK